jgi:hypothetical protein
MTEQKEKPITVEVLSDMIGEIQSSNIEFTPATVLDILTQVEDQWRKDRAAARAEIKSLQTLNEKMDEHLKEQFDSMQVSLIAFVMWKCKRSTLAIDIREISQGSFPHQIVECQPVDGYLTRYSVKPPSKAR